MKIACSIMKKGYLTERGADILGLTGILLIFSAAYFFEEWSGFWFWALSLLGAFLGYLGAYGGLAKKFGFQAPFTNDPLGWREAKKSYEKPGPSTDENDKSS